MKHAVPPNDSHRNARLVLRRVVLGALAAVLTIDPESRVAAQPAPAPGLAAESSTAAARACRPPSLAWVESEPASVPPGLLPTRLSWGAAEPAQRGSSA